MRIIELVERESGLVVAHAVSCLPSPDTTYVKTARLKDNSEYCMDLDIGFWARSHVIPRQPICASVRLLTLSFGLRTRVMG